MNIHVTSPDPAECAKFLDNKRVNKMMIENTQMLSTVIWETNEMFWFQSNDESVCESLKQLYGMTKPFQPNNALIRWIAESKTNAMWMLIYTFELYRQYRQRYNKSAHKCKDRMELMAKHSDHLFSYLPDTGGEVTPFLNRARHVDLGIDHTDNPDVYQAYQDYLEDRWAIERARNHSTDGAANERPHLYCREL